MTEKLYSYAWLKKQTDADLIGHFTNISMGPPSDASFYLNELHVRAQDRINSQMRWMTVAIAFMTLVNVVIVVMQMPN